MRKSKTREREKVTRKKKTIKQIVPPQQVSLQPQYVEARGARKTAVARARMWIQKNPSFIVNGKPLEQYFQMPELQKTARESLEKAMEGKPETWGISVIVRGGGVVAQAQAVRHAVAKALVKFNSELKLKLKAWGLLTRDSRMRERKKFGLRRARRARQWRKR